MPTESGENYAQIQHRLQERKKNSPKPFKTNMLDFNMRGQQERDFFTGRKVMNYELVFWPNMMVYSSNALLGLITDVIQIT